MPVRGEDLVRALREFAQRRVVVDHMEAAPERRRDEVALPLPDLSRTGIVGSQLPSSNQAAEELGDERKARLGRRAVRR
ncbi:hypothetical protein [Candidatus Palauibacter sp.]|uniref:hypothetical protein n=1 Tax=Candidatus Palauibacter sp. TaxID=3101350 RepID=UPI003B01233E